MKKLEVRLTRQTHSRQTRVGAKTIKFVGNAIEECLARL